MDATTLTIGQLLAKGGLTMLPIYVCSLATLAVFVRKWLEYQSHKFHDLNWVPTLTEAVQKQDYATAHAVGSATPHPAGAMTAAMVTALREQPGQVADEGLRVGQLQIQTLEKNVGLLSFLAQVAPLFGLLGTVLGMVDMFIGLQGAGTANIDIADLAGGIWKALLTTAAGLCVAVPALAAYSYFTSRVELVRSQLGDVAQRVLYSAGMASDGGAA